MTQLALSKRIASIVIYGHVFLFMFGLIVMLVGPYDKIDTLQMILMGSPLLAAIGLSAFIWMSKLPANDQSAEADPAWARLCTVVSSIFILALFAAYATAAFNHNMDISILKIVVGAIETVLGTYMGVIRDTLFPKSAE